MFLFAGMGGEGKAGVICDFLFHYVSFFYFFFFLLIELVETQLNLSIVSNSGSKRAVKRLLHAGAHHQERPSVLRGIRSTVADVVIFRTQIARESGFRSSGCCKTPTSFLLRSSAILPNACPFI